MNIKKFLPHIIAAAVFIALTMAYFSPLMSGKKLRQSDISNWIGASKEIVDFREKTGQEALWTNSMFGGMPAYQISVLYPANLVQYVNNIIWLGLPTPANFVWQFMIGFYFLLIVLGVDKRIAILGSIGFAFSSYYIIYIGSGHNSQAHAIGYMAPVIAGIIMTYRGRWLLGTAITGLMLALELYANHLQITYYLMLIIFLLGFVEFVKALREKTLPYFFKATASLVIVAGLASLTSITNLMATAEYGKYSTRGPSELTADKENQTTGLDRDYITGWSYGVGESFTLFIPNFKGGASEPIAKESKDALKDVDPNYKQYIGQGCSSYFGDMPFTGGPAYAGSIICLLFVLGLFVIKGDMKWWIVSATVLGLTLSWGRHFMGLTNLFLDYVPGYDKFRTVSMMLVIVEFMAPLMAALALDKIVRETDFIQKKKKLINYGLGIVVGISLMIVVAPSAFTSFSKDEDVAKITRDVKSQNGSQEVIDTLISNLETTRKAVVSADALRTFFFVLLAAILIYTFIRYKFRNDYLIYSLLVLILIDLWSVDRRYLSTDDFVNKTAATNPFPISAADEAIKQDPAKSYRVLNLAADVFNDASTSYYHQSVGGYHGAKLKRYKELVDYRLTPELQNLREALSKKDGSGFSQITSQSTLNMLNTKYIIYNPEAAPLTNTAALGNAWFVRETKIVPNSDSEIAALNNFDPKATAIVDQRYNDLLTGFNANYDSSASITLTDYKPNDLQYQSKSSTEQLAVFSEIYYDKGWNAYVDGSPAKYMRANYVLRAMRIPAGEHKIEFKFEPAVYNTGEKISLASSALLLIMVAGLGFIEWKKSKA